MMSYWRKMMKVIDERKLVICLEGAPLDKFIVEATVKLTAEHVAALEELAKVVKEWYEQDVKNRILEFQDGVKPTVSPLEEKPTDPWQFRYPPTITYLTTEHT